MDLIPKGNMILLDGEQVEAKGSLVRSLTPGVLTGEGVFETMRSFGGKIFTIDRHLFRLSKGLRHFHIKTPLTPKKFKDLLYRSLALSGLQDARIRLTVWRKNGRVHTAVISSPYEAHSDSKYKNGFSAVISDKRRNGSSKLANIKSIAYLPFLTAYKKAQRKGRDEAILLNKKGILAEASRSNIFFFQDGWLNTPHLSCGCLNGITRQITIEIAKNRSIPVRQVHAQPKVLWEADEAFITNSLIGIMPLTRVDGHVIGRGKAGPMTVLFQKEYRKLFSFARILPCSGFGGIHSCEAPI